MVKFGFHIGECSGCGEYDSTDDDFYAVASLPFTLGKDRTPRRNRLDSFHPETQNGNQLHGNYRNRQGPRVGTRLYVF
jgi:hypothetical protein